MAKTQLSEALLEGLARPETRTCVLLYSGGVDCTAAGIMMQDQGYEIHPLTIDYGQSSAKVERYLGEICAKELWSHPATIIETDLLKKLTRSLLLGHIALSDEDAWVPGRNTLFMTIAGIYAAQINADGISLGYMLDDNGVFGDNDYFHHKAFELLISRSIARPIEVFLPTMSKPKKDLLAMLHKRNLLDKTVSCWNAELTEEGSISTCGSCANCIERNTILTVLEDER